MPLAQTKFVPYEMKTSVVKIFSYEHGNHTGVIKNPYFKDNASFGSTMQMLKLIDELQDSLNFPQKSMLTRSFTEETAEIELERESADAAVDRKPIASFSVNILFRQNASWQGSIIWMENAMQSEFRSALELLFLMDSVLSGAASGRKRERPSMRERVTAELS
jgi:hypothetical protein